MSAINCNFAALLQVFKFNDNHGPDGRFAAGDGGMSALDKRLVDYKPDRSLSDPTKVQQITHLLPDTHYVAYGRTPFLAEMHRRMGIGDPMTTPVADYMAARKALFKQQPEEEIPLHGMTVTQKVVNTDKIAEGLHRGAATYGHMPIDAVRYNGHMFVMNGHHRAVSAAARGDATLHARVLDLSTVTTKFDFEEILKHNPYHGPDGRFATGDGASFVSFGGVFSGSNAKDRTTFETKRTSAMETEMKALADRGINLVKIYNTTGADATDPAGVAKGWAKAMPEGVTPTTIVDAYLGKDGKAMRGSIVIAGDRIRFTATDVTNFFGGSATEIQRTITLNNLRVEHNFLQLIPSSQGGGVVKQMFASCLPLYQKLGLQGIDVHANIDAGGYAWARYGFDVNPGARLRQYRASASRAINDSVSALQAAVTLTPESKDELKAINDTYKKYRTRTTLPGKISGVSTPSLDAQFKSVGGTHKFMAATLGGLNWYGNLDLTNARQVKTLSTYIGTKMKPSAKKS